MKVGKESIAGVMAALEAWEVRDHHGIRRREREALDLWKGTLEGLAGIEAVIVPDPTNNPLDRLEINVLPESGFTAAGLATALARAQIPIIVRNHEVERGHFFLDPCNLHPGEAETVARELHSLLSAKERPSDAMLVPQKSARNIRKWPD
jgi:L-seryl-tRNA(Ser) seleniumtransferase